MGITGSPLTGGATHYYFIDDKGKNMGTEHPITHEGYESLKELINKQ